MKEPISIRVESDDDTTSLALDTIRRGKQALIFVNSKRSAEASAERIGKAVGKQDIRLEELAEKVLNATTKPTKQCKRLAYCVRRAQAFHHAGLTSKQRSLIEDAFREGQIKTISATPTLCLAKGTRVWSGVEEIPVESLTKKQLHVLDQNTIVQITNESVVSKTNSQPLMQIRCASGKSIQTTSNHRFYVKRNNKKQVVELRNIQQTDKIATIGRIHVTEKTAAVSEFTKNYSSPKDYVFDTDLAYFIGVMLGDGYSGATITDESLIFKSHGCLVSHDKEIRDAAITISKKFNLSHRLSKNSHGVPQVFLSKTNWFREFLARCGIHQSVDKHLAKKLQKLPKRELAALLRGYFDTDGYIQKRGSIGVSSISLQLIKDVQKMLLRFNIPTRFRSRPASSMKTGNKEYKTKKQYELTIAHTKAIMNFSQHIGFGVARKSKALATLVDQQEIIQSVSCPTCNYAISKNLFDGRTKEQQSWAKKKLQVIQTLGACGELGSNELTKKLGFLPRKKENRLNAHYSLIQKRKIGSRSKTEWYWSLNAIGKWVYEKAKNHSFDVSELLEKNTCPVCTNELQKTLRKNWRSNDMDGDIFWDVIREIKTIPAQETVYDVVLPNTPKNDHLFVAEGFFTHNSAGVDTPAFRTIIRDTKRFTGAGMSDIPVLEYHQMAGRSGRPDYGDDYGEAILIAKNDAHAEQLTKKYVYGEPEAIYSKVAAQPVLRTYCLSLAASEFVQTTNELQAFFADTFFAHQYGDASEIKNKILNTIEQLRDWGFLESHKQEATADFTSASELTSTDEKIKATPLGKRVSELYIDPLSAHELIDGMYKASTTKPEFFAWLHLVSSAAEARPLLRVKATDYEPLQEFLAEAPDLLVNEPSIYDPSYEQYLEAIKTAKMLEAWANEIDEEDLLEKYNVRPGELRRRLDIADWLCYSASELARILQFHHHISPLQKTRYRLKYGAKEELLALLKLRNIGRVRARKLYRNNIRSAGDIKKADVKTLTQLTGPKTAVNLKKQVGEEVTAKPSTQKRKGQLSLHAKRFKK